MNQDQSNSSEDIFKQLIPDLAEGIKSLDIDLEDPFPLCDEIADLNERYESGDAIGAGGMKNILETHDALTDRHVAMAHLKKTAEPELIEHFFKEARLTAHLEHPNIVPLYDIGFNKEGEPYFTMKLLGGRNLTDLIKEFSTETDFKKLLPKIVDVMIKVCDAMAFAHSKGVIHLDLKPDNIRIGDYGEVLICDWGLAKTLNDDDYHLTEKLSPDTFNATTLDGFIKGSPGYMAPEQIEAKLGVKDKRTDIYALGGLLYELLCFQIPTPGQSLDETLKNTLNGLRPKPRAINYLVPHSLEAVALKALETNADQRYQEVQSFRKDLFKWLGGFATSAEEHSFVKSLKLLILRHRLLTSFLFILLISGITFALQINEKKQLAVEALILYKAEQSKKELFGKEAAPRLIGLAMGGLKNNDITTASEMISLAVEADPTYFHAWHSKARIDFIKMNITEARKSMAQTTQVSNHQAVLDLQKFLDQRKPEAPDKLSLNEVLELAKRPEARYDIVSLIETNIHSYTLNEQIALTKALLQLQHPKIETFVMYSKVEGNHLYIDLSQNKNLKKLSALSYLPITHLNINKCIDANTLEFNKLPLIEIHLNKTNFRSWKELYEVPTLKVIHIGKKMFASLPPPPDHITIKQ